MKANKVLSSFPCAVIGDDDGDDDGNTLQLVLAGKAWPANSEKWLPSDFCINTRFTHTCRKLDAAAACLFLCKAPLELTHLSPHANQQHRLMPSCFFGPYMAQNCFLAVESVQLDHMASSSLNLHPWLPSFLLTGQVRPGGAPASLSPPPGFSPLHPQQPPPRKSCQLLKIHLFRASAQSWPASCPAPAGYPTGIWTQHALK